MAIRRPQLGDLIGPMDINEASTGIDHAPLCIDPKIQTGFESAQPQDS